MSFLEIFALVASSVTIFGLIVAVFSVYNGRMTQRLIREIHTETLTLIQGTQDLIAREEAATRQLIVETRDLLAQELVATRQLIQQNQEATREILLRITEILGRIDERVR
jgi:hypothetical protein